MRSKYNTCFLSAVLLLISVFSSAEPESGAIDFKNLNYTGKESLQAIQTAALNEWEKNDNVIALAIARQTMLALDESAKLMYAAEMHSGLLLSNKEREWLVFVQQQADNGNPFYQNTLGTLYYSGIGVSRSVKKAFDLCFLAADQDFALAQRALGMINELEYGDYLESIKWYRKAGEQGLLFGYSNLGQIYLIKDFEGYDIEEALKHLKVAAEGGLAEAQFIYGKVLQDYLPRNESSRQQVAKWIEKSAVQGNIEALDYLGNHCRVNNFAYDILNSLNLEIPADEAAALKYLAHASESYFEGGYFWGWRGVSLGYISDITCAGSLFPEVIIDHATGEAPIQKFVMNQHGYGVDGVRFTMMPLHRRFEFEYILAVPSDVEFSGFISPIFLQRSIGFTSFRESEYSFKNSPWPEDYKVYTGSILNNDFMPDEEHVFSIHFDTDKEVEIFLGLSCTDRSVTLERKCGRFSYPISPGESKVELAFGLEVDLTPNEMLEQAARVNNIEFINYAVAEGANIKELPVLAVAADFRDDLDLSVIKRLLELGADPREGNALHALMTMGKSNRDPYLEKEFVEKICEAVRLYVKAGASVNSVDSRGITPLMLATQTPDPGLVRLLLELGADPSIVSEFGETAEDMCITVYNRNSPERRWSKTNEAALVVFENFREFEAAGFPEDAETVNQ